MQISDLAPEKVFRFFSEIAKIPHGSGNTGAIASYCLAFAKERGLEAYRDECGNVMIFKDGTPGYEHSGPVILQGHLDMVCEKDPDCPKDMAHEGVELVLDGDYLRANGTTLGGDDGIAVAYILALLDDSGEIAHPPIEALLTADEEMGMRGANGLDASRLKGKRLINMDSEAEGVLTVSCAGAARIFFRLPIRNEAAGTEVAAKKITLRGLLGGHSGIDIGKSRQNAAKLLAQLLLELSRRTTFRLADFSAGKTMDSIPASGQMILCFEPSQTAALEECLDAFQAWYHAVCGRAEPDVRLAVEDVPTPAQCLDAPSTSRTLSALMLVPNGVANISEDIPFFVLTSSNLGRVLIEDETLKMDIMILVGAGLLVSAGSQALGALIGAKLTFFDKATWTVLIVTALGLIFALTPFGKIKGTEEVSNVMLYSVIALIASRADLSAMGNAPAWLLTGLIILVIHVGIMIILAKLLKIDIFTAAVASLANIGGTATAPVLAGAYSSALVPVGIIMALLGYVVGTGGGLLVAQIMSLLA